MYFLESFNDDRHSQIIVEVLFEKETIYVTPYARRGLQFDRYTVPYIFNDHAFH